MYAQSYQDEGVRSIPDTYSGVALRENQIDEGDKSDIVDAPVSKNPWENECEIKASLDIKKYTKKQYLREFVVRLTLQKNIKEVFRLNVTSDSNSN